MKRIYALLLIMIILVVTTVACSSSQSAEEKGTQTLTLATWHASDGLSKAVEGFNSSQTKYQIEVKDYGQYDNYDSDDQADYVKGQTMLNMDIAVGNIPDIINLHGIDRTVYAKNGAFINLYDFMKSDEKYNKQAFLTNYLQANEVDDGLYWLSPTFFVDSLFANAKLTNGMTQWSMEEFLKVIQTVHEDHIEIMGHQSPTEFMTFVGAGNQFLNQVQETVHYNNPVYAQLLEFSAKLNESNHGHDHSHSHGTASADEDATKFQSGQRLLERGAFGNFDEYLSYFALYGEQPVTMIGYPTLDGSSGSYFGMGHDLYAISAASKASEGAWEYIKFALDMDVDQLDQVPEFSVVLDQLHEQIQKSVNNYTDGQYISRKGIHLHLKKPSQTDVDEFMTMLKNIKSFANYESMFSKEIYTLYDDFYAGTKTSAEVSRILQDKYTLFFKENQ
ncbi:ABC transporter substrate-binding protein [Paenibacillus sp. FSL K6-2862]|uniref:ABC transporter substrate-binding protein n=1 Tax=Paenibacillus sp. FSL K6-2862 TaxID=2921484 RepID=UPI0030F728EC